MLASIINDKGKDFGINSDEDLWHFLSQAGHETGGFNTLNVTESTYWTTASKLAGTYSRFTMDSLQASLNENIYFAPDYLQNSSGVANVAMCCKYGNGDVASGDGYKYRGRGIFQLTWKDNYTAFKTWYNNNYNPDIDPVTEPEIIASNDTLAVLSGLWYYKTRVINEINIDSSTTVDNVTVKINSKSKKGLTDRKERFQKAKDSINCL
ncbi:glycoside hydrolase family 19 protein [Bizionia sp.]|uniref:glycoside hydrolase family 19 protein n=1 Tax=Bizionia sp. TaxID=1954480 RepID=UPI003A8FE8CD